MHKILIVIRREYLQAVRTKMFWIGTLFIPAGIFALFGLVIVATEINPEKQRSVALLDDTGQLHESIAGRLAEHTLKDGRPEFLVERLASAGSLEEDRRSLEPRVLDGELYAIVVIGNQLEADDNFRLYRKSVGDEAAAQALERAISHAVVGLRLERSELDVARDELEALVSAIDLESYQVSETGETKKRNFEQAFIPTFGFVIILFITLWAYGFSMTRGVIQEKTNRVMEVLLGSLSPEQLMTGKILGIGLVGLTQMVVYMLVGGIARVLAITYMSGGDLDFIIDALAPVKLVFFVFFFLLGYFLFTSLFAIIGAVCNTEQDAQSLQFPVMMCLMVPYMTTFFFIRHPDSLVTVIVSLIPLFTPMVMFMRISVLMPPMWQILLSVVLTLGAIYLLFRVAARVFRIGTLMYGKRPTIPEIWRWVRG